MRRLSIICLLAACVCRASCAQNLAPEWKGVKAAIESRRAAVGAVRYETMVAGSLDAAYYKRLQEDESSGMKTPKVLPFVYELSSAVLV